MTTREPKGTRTGGQFAAEPRSDDVDDLSMPISFRDGDREISRDEWELSYCVSGSVLKKACRAEGLTIGGTNADRGRRLAEAGLTRAAVENTYGWRANRTGA